MTRTEILQNEKTDITVVNSTVVDTFRNLKTALRDAIYVFDKANKMVDKDVNAYIELRDDLEKMFDKYSKLYASVEKQDGYVGF